MAGWRWRSGWCGFANNKGALRRPGNLHGELIDYFFANGVGRGVASVDGGSTGSVKLG